MSFKSALIAAALTLGVAQLAAAQLGPPAGTIYASDKMFRTVGTPTDLPNHGQFDVIYVLGNGLANVAEAAPGEPGFNGGRWEVRPVTWLTISPTQFTNAGQVEAAAAAGQVSLGDVVRRFECPLIPIK
jgi:hypothetical protein